MVIKRNDFKRSLLEGDAYDYYFQCALCTVPLFLSILKSVDEKYNYSSVIKNGKMVRYCCVKGCKNHRITNDSRSFFRFPLKNKNQLKQWQQVVPTKSLITKHTYICSDHFDNSSFEIICGIRHLNKNAIPKFFDPDVLRDLQQKRNISSSATDSKRHSLVISKQLSIIPMVSKNEPLPTPTVFIKSELPSTHTVFIKSEVPYTPMIFKSELPSTSTVFEGEKSPSIKVKKEVATQVSPQRLAPSKREEELRKKVKNLQNQLRRKEHKISNVLNLLQELKKKGIMHAELEHVFIPTFSSLKLKIFQNKTRFSSDSKFH